MTTKRTPYDDEIKALCERRVILLRRKRLGTASVYHTDELAALETRLDKLALAESQWLWEGRPGAPRKHGSNAYAALKRGIECREKPEGYLCGAWVNEESMIVKCRYCKTRTRT